MSIIRMKGGPPGKMGQQTHSTGRPPFRPPAGGRRIGDIGGAGSAGEPLGKPLRRFPARCQHVSQPGSRTCENRPLSRSIPARFKRLLAVDPGVSQGAKMPKDGRGLAKCLGHRYPRKWYQAQYHQNRRKYSGF